MREKLISWDRSLFELVAARHWPGGDRVLPLLSHSADHGLLWFGVAGAAALAGGPGAGRAAVRGVASLALASATVNTLGKRAVRRGRPILDVVPVIRRLSRQPFTTSFPSGHSASAAAFATGVALERPGWGPALAPLAFSVCFSRVYTGVHYPGDVLAGAALGAGAALAVRALVPAREPSVPSARPRADAPALPDGRGLVVVASATAGQRLTVRDDPGAEVRAELPLAEVVPCGPAGSLPDALEKAAVRAAELGGALGAFGGDGTVNAAARAAVRHRLPLAVLPGGTYNHFARDLGITSVADAARAVRAGRAVAVDVGRFGDDGRFDGLFLNTFSIGSYPELVRVRERWAPRVGAFPAGVAAALHVLRTAEPVRLRVDGRRRDVWSLVAGNCAYRGLGPTPLRRHSLADGVLEVRMILSGRLARTRLLAAALTGVLKHSPVLRASRVRGLRVDGLVPGTHLSFDGEVAPAPASVTLTKERQALVVYRPR
ncbi:phosphatase PAP2 family protein [Streptomyces sp. AV19]|uniref:bifunctional phosphatase PAP2/diacylglycerol kinase family protein n=1 Tax=Streptomyces sp. AV19 TaxID=2793068 RepID=UPI0018FE1E93|nr:phosphatase PAP2 family protein [Streptomyces sp. AV19]MBH1937529.1 phosphatase PAP2 family protein [Streptomyces sp. AV19]MDG4533695.1 phosphatase PAP2 family protein [Streptomyces sp. AV19]